MKEANVKHTKFNLWAWRKLPECKQMVKIITTSMDARLSWREWILMKVHLLSCDPCVNFLKQIKFIRTTLQHSDEHLAPQDSSVRLTDEARNRLKEALKTGSGA